MKCLFTNLSIIITEIMSPSGCPVSDSPFRKWQRPDLPSKCTFHEAKSMDESPHLHVEV